MGRGKVGSSFRRRSALRFGSLTIGAEIPREIPLYNCNGDLPNVSCRVAHGNPAMVRLARLITSSVDRKAEHAHTRLRLDFSTRTSACWAPVTGNLLGSSRPI